MWFSGGGGYQTERIVMLSYQLYRYVICKWESAWSNCGITGGQCGWSGMTEEDS